MNSRSQPFRDPKFAQFGLITPSEWVRRDVGNNANSLQMIQRLKDLLPDIDTDRIYQGLVEFEDIMARVNVTQYFTHAMAERDNTILLVFLCSIGPFSVGLEQTFQDAAVQAIKSLDQGWDPPLTITRHDGQSGVYLRLERLIQESDVWPWQSSREVRYFFGHPELPYFALLTGVSPNTDVAGIFDLFDKVARTFYWFRPVNAWEREQGEGIDAWNSSFGPRKLRGKESGA